jgi:hypothetical protein
MKNLFLSIALCLLAPLCLPAQLNIYDTSNSNLVSNRIAHVASYSNDFPWVSYLDQPGITKLDGYSPPYTVANSGLPGDTVLCINRDNSGAVFIGTTRGLAMTDGTTWTVWDTSNSPLPSNQIQAIWPGLVSNQWWIATDRGMVQKYLNNWAVYDTSNSGIYSNDVVDIRVDNFGSSNIYVACRWGISIFDGTSWVNFDSNTVNFPSAEITSIERDLPNLYVGSAGEGVSMFNWTFWTVYDSSNSNLPSNYIHDMSIGDDPFFATDKGLHLMRNPSPINYTTVNTQIPSDSLTGIDPQGAFSSTQNGGYIEKYFGTRNGGIFTLETLVGISVSDAAGIPLQLSPNPSQSNLRVKTEVLANSYEIVDLSGRILRQEQGNPAGQAGEQHTMDVSDLPNGFYFVRVFTENGTATGRFVVQR